MRRGPKYAQAVAEAQARYEARKLEMAKRGYVPYDFPLVGANLFVSLPNGWEEWGVVTRVYKNGVRRVKHDSAGSINRCPCDLWKRSEP